MLCGISDRFQSLSPSERQVAHVLLTRPPLNQAVSIRKLQQFGPVRLACVRRAASVRPEPGSNSLFIVLNRPKALQSHFTKCDPAKLPLLVSLFAFVRSRFRECTQKNFQGLLLPINRLPEPIYKLLFFSLVVHFSRCCAPRPHGTALL